MTFEHISIMPRECMDALRIEPNGIYVDATTGGGGHSGLIAERLGDGGRLICFDRDDDALKAAKEHLADHAHKITFVKSNFCDMKSALEQINIKGVDGILFDLGVSSYQLDNKERGFSYMADAPLDMRMDKAQKLSAYDVVNTYTEFALMKLFFDYGEEKFSRKIARAIVEKREQHPINGTLALVEIIKDAMPMAAKREKQHPAKRVFQAIRIEVNDELGAVEQAVACGIELLNPRGRMAVMSFHSLEDRIVKRAFAENAKGCTCPPSFPICVCGNTPKIKLVSKGVITAKEEEVEQNPRARSAKLRVCEKV